ncbi:hypothetical protein [Nitrosospira sp. NRS527]|uniref:hypothetical protein n=1 Tax=Nitrosospira sp. NRS527 TaxID=155925 RepID=UPI001AF582A8|nr:hypothetical protein [Nitrosospira sp. NRS527]BCT69152.1 hypothetical protein NNRS527_02766 [Nitrosospira sp. NRS527]
MPILEKEEKMSALERELIDAAFRGDWAGSPKLPVLSEFFVQEDSRLFVQEEADITVRGIFLRELLLGLRTPAKDAEANSRLHGVRLRGAIIKGEIDLSDCKGTGGTPLPPLLLEHCIIHDGSRIRYPVVRNGASVEEKILSAINASNVRLSRLSLRGCRVSGRVDLTDATLDGDLEISDLKPLNNDCYCQISLRRCRIDGSVIAQKAHLRIQPGQCTEFGIPDYALNLVSANVHGSVWLQPDFYAQGGVSVRGAHINGNIWAEAAKLVAPDKIAFRAESLQCDGTVALHGREDKNEGHYEVHGKLDFLSATIGFLDLRGIHIRKVAAKDYALNLGLARVRTNLWLGNLPSGPKTIVEGSIDARGATVGGDLDLTGLTLYPRPDWEYAGILASNLRVGGNLILDDLTTSIDLESSHVESNLKVNNTVMKALNNGRYGLYAHNITIGNDCNLTDIAGTFDLKLSRIGGELKVEARDLTALNAKDAEVRGSVSISGIFMPLMEEHCIRFDGGSYRSGFHIGDPKSSLRFINPPNSLAPDIENTSKRHDEWIPTLSIVDACIANDFWVTKVRIAEVLQLQYSVIEAHKAPLSFYPNWVLVEVLLQLEEGRKAIIAFLKHRSDMTKRPILLGGLSKPIHQLNQLGMLNLDSARAVRDYLRFFCAYVWGEEGAFFIIETEKSLGGAKLSAPVEFAEVSVKKDEEKGWICIAMIRYANKLYRTRLHVNPDGNVEMTEDDLLADIEEENPTIFESPLRIITDSRLKADPGGAPFWLRMILPAALVEKITGEEITQDVRPVLQQLIQPRIQENEAVTTPVRAEISLRGLKARVFHHNLKKTPWGSWGPGIRLKLDGFEYERVKTEEKVENIKKDFDKISSSKPVDETADAHIRWLTRQYDCSRAKDNEQDACDQLIACAVEANRATNESVYEHESVYEPQPYEQLARALHNEGKYEVAKRITLAKLSLERRFVHHQWIRPFLCIMEKCFDYGLFPGKSVTWFLMLWLLVGTGAFYFANYEVDEPVLVRHSGAGTLELPGQRCGEEIDSLWYALDVFVPGLDLKQEDRCSVTTRDEAWPWRAFGVIYEILGAIVTPIMLLSVTGMLRRYIER